MTTDRKGQAADFWGYLILSVCIAYSVGTGIGQALSTAGNVQKAYEAGVMLRQVLTAQPKP